MDITEKRTYIIKKLMETENEQLLDDIYSLLSTSDNDIIYKTSNQEKKLIREARQDVAEGKFKSNDEVNKKFEEWLFQN